MPRRRRRAARTLAARALMIGLAALAVVRRDGRPGDVLLRHPPAVVVGVAPAPPAPRAAASAPAARMRAPKLLRSLAERARQGERVSVNVTAYCLQGTTRRGNYVRSGIIAADPKVFPLARHVDLYIGRRYFGRFLVDDTGRDIKGNRLDVWTESCRDARFFGRRYGTATLVQRGDAPAAEPDVGPSLR
jgi:3D (Asp-Asp-Asp) domain-containing protein